LRDDGTLSHRGRRFWREFADLSPEIQKIAREQLRATRRCAAAPVASLRPRGSIQVGSRRFISSCPRHRAAHARHIAVNGRHTCGAAAQHCCQGVSHVRRSRAALRPRSVTRAAQARGAASAFRVNASRSRRRRFRRLLVSNHELLSAAQQHSSPHFKGSMTERSAGAGRGSLSLPRREVSARIPMRDRRVRPEPSGARRPTARPG
jgi:hypothetical protein